MARPREFDEEQVLSAARGAFMRTGYNGTSLADLTAATGLGKGSLYGAFGDKHQLFQRVFEDYCADTCARLTKDLDGPDELALSRLTDYVRGIARDSACTEDGTRNGCMLSKTTAELAGHDDAITARAHQAFDDLEDHLQRAIEAAQRAGDLAADADAELHAALLLAALRGMESLGKAGMAGPKLRAIADGALAALPR